MLNQLKIKTKLLLLAGVPALALVALTVIGALRLNTGIQALHHAQDLAALVTALGEVVHELQKERGMSSGFLASRGAKFADRLPGQRAASDRAINALNAAFAVVDLKQTAPDYSQLLQAALRGLDRIAELRTRIDRFEIPPPESFQTYSALIAELLEVATRSSNELPEAQLARLANAKSTLLYLKERNGQERALLSGAFGAGQITAPNYEILLTLLSDQANFQRLTLAFATPEQRAALESALDHPSIKEVEQVERLVRERGPGAALDYEAERWFDQITTKIDRLRAVEERFSQDIAAAVTAEIQHARMSLIAFLGLTGLTLVVTFGLGVLIVRGILRQMGGEPAFAVEVAQTIAQGILDQEIQTRPGDTTSLLAAMKHMQHELRERIERERRLAAESRRIQNALDKASTQVMVVDAHGDILYMNAAMNRLMHDSEPDLRRDLPNFRAANLLGSPFAALQPPRASGQTALAELTAERIEEIRLGGRLFRRVLNPVFNDQGERLGSVIEWTDRTLEDQVETELGALVEAAVQGDFSGRLELTGKRGFFRHLSEGLNQLLAIVSSGLDDLAHVMNAIAQGDLTQDIQAEYAGTFGQLKSDTNATLTRLREVVGQILEASAAINSAAQELASGNLDLSARTESQASSLEQTASSMERFNTSVQRNAHNAQQANELASTANQRIQRSGETVRSVVGTMNAIQEASRRIADIIGVIDGIAFQTNILALNAAVEAARAGEQGRGFAVVAAEVRNLAQRSAQAAKEIKTLILDSMTKVEGGVKLAYQAGVEMDEVVAGFRQVAALIAEIADASLEQSSGIAQVTQSITQIDAMTQQNAALVEQAAAATESLQDQARELVQAVSIFKIESNQQVAR
ncbi:nitrate- and nitrite sensing domain-containing protein [Thermochromatium tepidum]|uniref:Methyl-accepting chemotaxis protein n=1 Tax=Thermochromatium tepidum ATCC 43061 TaxID=316276 RepID=A0A6I6EC58_THETI|nr:nitrate- and nitrite sensing domain-containing protein [Thermochromatium tepidum]QGU32529.1 methyl-accepting chemotaxis protein [Thermochromatium tepidum ATCC 43061]